VVVLDKASFPRDKVCAGWITPPVLSRLALDAEEYRFGRTLQPFTGFLVGTVGGRAIETRYDRTVSFGIRRPEFDHYLLERSGARLRLGEALTTLERSDGRWVANRSLSTPVVIGAGGHFCPTARLLGVAGRGETVVAQAAEVKLTPDEARRCPVDPETPELYFSPDLRGYGWCLRKGDYLNVGLGRAAERNLRAHLASFLAFLEQRGRLPSDLRLPLKGHAYRLRSGGVSPVAGEGILWVGDAVGLADPKSGEGIGPAVESGIRAAELILAAKGQCSREKLQPEGRVPPPRSLLSAVPIPQELKAFVGRRLLATRWFSRRVVLDRWFLQA
jgi:flavin-dependent dehydrogenase